MPPKTIKVRLRMLKKFKTPGFYNNEVDECKNSREVFTVIPYAEDNPEVNYLITSGTLNDWYIRKDETQPVAKPTVIIAHR